MSELDYIDFLRSIDVTAFRGGVILLSTASIRILQCVRRLFEDADWKIWGALTKPASHVDLQRILCVSGTSVAALKRSTASAEAAPFSFAELFQAHAGQQWLLQNQPNVEIISSRAVDLEALLPWRHPQQGLTAPERFISTAEDCGLFDNLTDWVLAEAFAQQRHLCTQALGLSIAINVSMVSLGRPGFDRRLAAIPICAGVRPQNVVLGFTESRLMAPGLIALESLVRLQMYGFGLAIDDFGTGQSSLIQLCDVPFC